MYLKKNIILEVLECQAADASWLKWVKFFLFYFGLNGSSLSFLYEQGRFSDLPPPGQSRFLQMHFRFWSRIILQITKFIISKFINNIVITQIILIKFIHNQYYSYNFLLLTKTMHNISKMYLNLYITASIITVYV